MLCCESLGGLLNKFTASKDGFDAKGLWLTCPRPKYLKVTL